MSSALECGSLHSTDSTTRATVVWIVSWPILLRVSISALVRFDIVGRDAELPVGLKGSKE